MRKKIEVGTDISKITELDFKPIYFDYRMYVIRADAETELNKIVKIMNDHPTMIVKINSYTDCRATTEFNQKLSERRAKATVEYIAKRITKPERITGKGFGETKLVNGCECEEKVVSVCPEEAHQQNRRSEFFITKK